VFHRQKLSETPGHFRDGLLSGIERKTGWLMAGQAGLARPYWMQAAFGVQPIGGPTDRHPGRPSEARAGIAKRWALQSVTIPDKASPFRDDGNSDSLAAPAKPAP